MQMLQADKFIACLVIIIIIGELLLLTAAYNLISAAAAVCGINFHLWNRNCLQDPSIEFMIILKLILKK